MVLALRRLHEGASADALVDALEGIAFEEWLAVVGYGRREYAEVAARFLVAVASEHPDDGWRFNAIDQLDNMDRLDSELRSRLLASERDPEVIELLKPTHR